MTITHNPKKTKCVRKGGLIFLKLLPTVLGVGQDIYGIPQGKNMVKSQEDSL